MADKKSLLDAVKDRRSIYSLSKESTISDEKIKELVDFTIEHTPSAFNVQVSPVQSVQSVGQSNQNFLPSLHPSLPNI